MQELEVPKHDLEIKTFGHGIFIESLITAEENQRVNFWNFLDFNGSQLGSYIYESRSKSLLSENRTNCNIGYCQSTSFHLEGNSMIFSEREGLKLDAVNKYIINQEKSSVTVEREWMKTCHGKPDYLRDGNFKIALKSSFILIHILRN